ncbi:tRNA (guanosine(37)-N1)-methyltransferase TrmD [candidate division WOR-1 bacterium RIFOXYB2_FULL_48_7]|uniref:tRNA (guanine-N(1)-)-methyltransferase n=1 Tax=candidate division WOR-1 bacterium RIFOXYB2_FULL_48_7 TaxID=1802583 RepID=A0A1F4TDV3_UNCSA|nr:MAG: tRNA (guanosine(37)-N1)-methyltransferase TrmD [candidate division WOR-1 bacterium RIFOXYB2_FULL_48_7]
MEINILTLFPEMFSGFLNESLLKKAQDKGLLKINIINLRDFTADKHKTVDDSPYGGGAGMVMKAEVIQEAINSGRLSGSRKIFMCPSGEVLNNQKVLDLVQYKSLTILCGHYEGIDERARSWFDEEISIGDYVLTGGELPAAVLIDAIARHIPGIVKEAGSVQNDSFYDGLLDYPSYTRPEELSGERVPEVLLSGNHAEIARWRRKEAIRRTLERRPDLLAKANLTELDKELLEELWQTST